MMIYMILIESDEKAIYLEEDQQVLILIKLFLTDHLYFEVFFVK